MFSVFLLLFITCNHCVCKHLFYAVYTFIYTEFYLRALWKIVIYFFKGGRHIVLLRLASASASELVHQNMIPAI